MNAGSPNRAWWIAVAFTGGMGVAIGAFGAHGLEGLLADWGMDSEKVAKRVSQFETGTRYHLVHAVALLALASGKAIEGILRFTATLFLVGVVLFSGSLYLLVLTDTPWLGAVTPLGGLSWILAWSSLVLAPVTSFESKLEK